jgi:hypothetical protein
VPTNNSSRIVPLSFQRGYKRHPRTCLSPGWMLRKGSRLRCLHFIRAPQLYRAGDADKSSPSRNEQPISHNCRCRQAIACQGFIETRSESSRCMIRAAAGRLRVGAAASLNPGGAGWRFVSNRASSLNAPTSHGPKQNNTDGLI